MLLLQLLLLRPAKLRLLLLGLLLLQLLLGQGFLLSRAALATRSRVDGCFSVCIVDNRGWRLDNNVLE